MKRIEIALASIATLALVFIFWPFPGSKEIFAFTITILSIIYFYLGFILLNNIRLRAIFKKTSYGQTTRTNIILAIISGVVVSQLLVGILFKLLFLPGAHEMLTIGLIFSGLVIISILVIKKFNNYDFKGIFARLIPAFIIAFVLYNFTSSSLIRFIYRNYPDYAEAYIDSLNNPGDKELEKREHEEYEKMFKKFKE